VIKDGKQVALADYATISSQTGLDVEEILRSHNQKLKSMSGPAQKVFDKELAPSPVKLGESLTGKAVTKVSAAAAKKDLDLIVPEEDNEGKLTYSDLKNFLRFSTGPWGVFWFFFFGFTPAFTQLGTTYWVSHWTEQDPEEQSKTFYPLMFGGILLLYVVLTFGRALFIIFVAQTSATGLHNTMVDKVIRSKIVFFDSNPVGRILTRFSKDMTVLDIQIPYYTGLAMFGIFRTISVAITVVSIHPLILVAILLALFFMSRILSYAIGSQRETSRAESVMRGPIHSSFTNVVNGLVSLRAYERLSYYRMAFIDQLEKSCNVTFTFFAVNRFLSIVLDSICLSFTMCVASFSVFAKGSMDNDILAFTIQIVTDVIVYFAFSLRTTAEIENLMTSSQRIHRYTELESEDHLTKDYDAKLTQVSPSEETPLPSGWPSSGVIEFKGVTMRYREGLEPSLKNLDCRIQGHMKVGVVGRTGAGKSSIIQALFRLCDLDEGSIVIDDVDIKDVGLHLLRKNISFIP